MVQGKRQKQLLARTQENQAICGVTKTISIAVDIRAFCN